MAQTLPAPSPWPILQGHASEAQSVSYEVEVKAELVFQASAIWCLLQEVRDVAAKVEVICLTLETSHK